MLYPAELRARTAGNRQGRDIGGSSWPRKSRQPVWRACGNKRGLATAKTMRMLLLSLTALLGGCAQVANMPSLAPRAAEAIDPRVPVPEPVLPTAVDPALSRQLAASIDQAQAGHGSFQALAGGARSAAASAGPRQSESWIAAQQLLSALVAARGPVTRALADIDEMGAQRVQRLGGIAAADLRAIQSASQQIAALDRAEAALIDELQARLGA